MDIPELIDFAPPECLERGFDLDWYMTRAERFALLHLLAKFKPNLSLEVGTFRGGSLQALSLHSKHVISIDIDPQASARLAGRFDNVTYKVGDSSLILPNLIDRSAPMDDKPSVPTERIFHETKFVFLSCAEVDRGAVVHTTVDVSLQEAWAKTPTGKKRETTHVVRCETEILRVKATA